MAVLNIVTDEDLLHQSSKLVSEAFLHTKEFRRLLRDMKGTMKSKHGVGLAAVQIGELLSIFVMDCNGYPLVCINPKIIPSPQAVKGTMTEGCLSIPGETYETTRPSCLILKFINEKGIKEQQFFEGFSARIIEHEVDHINGLLINRNDT